MRVAVEAMAAACFVGVDPYRLAHERDPLMLRLMQEAIAKAVEMQRQRDETLARRIINELSAAMRRSKRS